MIPTILPGDKVVIDYVEQERSQTNKAILQEMRYKLFSIISEVIVSDGKTMYLTTSGRKFIHGRPWNHRIQDQDEYYTSKTHTIIQKIENNKFVDVELEK